MFHSVLPRGWIAVVPLLFVVGLPNGYAVSMGGGSPPALDRESVISSASQLKRDYEVTSIPLRILLDEVSETERAAFTTQPKDQPLRVGFARDVPSPYRNDLAPSLVWEQFAGTGRVTAFSITSPEARALRVALQMEGVPDNAEIRFFGTQDAETFGPVSVASMRQRQTDGVAGSPPSLFWSPVIKGDTIGIEVYLPSPPAAAFRIIAPKIQHLVYSLQDPDAKNLDHIGHSSFCNIDVHCRSTVPDNLSAAVAKFIYSDALFSYLCTGTLLNNQDPASWIPYFMTAHHCISTQSTANTIDSYWFFERATCDGPAPTSVTHFTGGADLLATDTDIDFSFLRLRDSQISNLAGIYFAGWSSTANPTNLTVTSIHHPSGDLKKWSQGLADGYAPYSGGVDGAGNHIRVTWSQGITEGGSSGAGLFATTGEQNGQQLLVGQLHGGLSFCSDPTAPDWYGRFDLSYPSISHWLEASGNTSTAVLESPSQGSYESGIGLIRGWVCQANSVEIQIDGGPRRQVAYGTARGDTLTACGDTDNGFGFTYNWNLLGSGNHTLQAFADGVAFATVNFTVATLGQEFLRNASGDYLVSDFPQAGRSLVLRWAEPHQNFIITDASRTLSGAQPRASAVAALESPQQGSFESGIGLIRGWVCQANSVEIQIDAAARRQVAYGTARGDTLAACGDTDNGFGFTFNWNLLGNGSHTLRAFADGIEFAHVSFTVTTLGVEYLQGASGEYLLSNFPQTGDSVTVRWAEAHQNFVIVSSNGS